MTGATITESKQKLTPETRFTHQKNPVRKGKKGEKNNNNNKEESPTKPQCLNTSQNPEQKLVTRKKNLSSLFLFEKRRIHHETGEGNGGGGKEGKREGQMNNNTNLVRPETRLHDCLWKDCTASSRRAAATARNANKCTNKTTAIARKTTKKEIEAQNRNSEEGGGHHHLLLFREELQTLIPGPQSKILIFHVPKTKCPPKTKLPISSPQSKCCPCPCPCPSH
jgi:hypothetical protein